MSAINPSPEEMRLDLMASISESIQAVSKEKETMKVNSLSRANPGKVAEILYHYEKAYNFVSILLNPFQLNLEMIFQPGLFLFHPSFLYVFFFFLLDSPYL